MRNNSPTPAITTPRLAGLLCNSEYIYLNTRLSYGGIVREKAWREARNGKVTVLRERIIFIRNLKCLWGGESRPLTYTYSAQNVRKALKATWNIVDRRKTAEDI